MIHRERIFPHSPLEAGSITSQPDAASGWVPEAPRIISWSSYNWTANAVEEEMDHANGPTRWNPCEHTNIRWQLGNPLVTFGWNVNNVKWHWFSGYPAVIDWATTLVSRVNDPTIMKDLNVDHDTLAYEAAEHVWPQVEQYMDESAANFAIDATKLHRTAAQAGQICLRARAALALLKKKFKSDKYFSPNWTIKQIIRSGSEANLISRYVIIPTVDDLKQIYASVKAIRTTLDNLQRGAGRLVYRRYTKSLKQDEKTQSVQFSNWAKPTASTINGKRYSDIITSTPKGSFTFHIWFSYDMPDWNRALLATGVFLDMLGLNFNPRIAWDAMRYSFVVDWVLRVGEFLGQFQRPWVKPTVVVHKCWATTHYVVRNVVRAWKTAGLYPQATPFGPVTIGCRELEYYKRAPSSTGFLRLKTSGLSAYEFVMASSLIGARVR